MIRNSTSPRERKISFVVRFWVGLLTESIWYQIFGHLRSLKIDWWSEVRWEVQRLALPSLVLRAIDFVRIILIVLVLKFIINFIVPIRYDVSFSVINNKFEAVTYLDFYVCFEAFKEIIILAWNLDSPWIIGCEFSKDIYFWLVLEKVFL